MKKQILFIGLFIFVFSNSYAQPANIYQPNGSTTNFGKVTSDSLNYYVVNYPALTLMKIDGGNNATVVTTLTIDPFQTMIWNNGKGIYPVANGSSFKLFDGNTATDITGGQLPVAGYTADKVIAGDYFHKGNFTYFRTSNKIFKTDYTSAASIQTLATVEYAGGTLEMQHTTNSIIFSDLIASSSAPACLKRIDLISGNIVKIDSSATGSYDYGTVYYNEYYFSTPFGPGSVGNSKIYKVSDNGTKTILYTETAAAKNIVRIVGVTPNGVIAIRNDNIVGSGAEFISVSGGIATALNFNTVANALPNGNGGFGGNSRTTNTLVYFETYDTLVSVSSNKALWVTDGTLSGTKKIVGGPLATFEISNLSTLLNGSAEHCDNDLYYSGRNGSNAIRLIHLDATNYSLQTYTFGLPATQPSIRKTASGIVMIGSPLPTSSAEKAIFKVNCSTSNDIEENYSDQILFDIFPNPCKGKITVNLSENIGSCKLSVYTILGEKVSSRIIDTKSMDIDLNLKPGLYFATMETNQKKSTKKIIIE